MNHQKAEIYVARLKANYPDPRRPVIIGVVEDSNDKYCVGGAYLQDRRSVREKIKDWFSTMFGGAAPLYLFPGAGEIARALQEDNPALTWVSSDFAAHVIINCNDAGDFERAWLVLERALGWHKGQGSCITLLTNVAEGANKAEVAEELLALERDVDNLCAV